MKCLCGYEYYYNCLEKIQKGDYEFIKINVIATVEEGYEPEKRVRIFACPKCNTLKIAGRWE